jgi:hypothetical protein
MAKHAGLISDRPGQSMRMSDDEKKDTGEVANPTRTQVDEDPLSQGQPNRPEDDRTPSKQRRDPHDQPWGQVAEEVKKAVEDADGPLD